MPVPWLRLLDLAAGVTSLARHSRRRSADWTSDPSLADVGPFQPGQLEARLTGVVVAALKEAFDRDHTRLEIERGQIEAERRRAERALRLELIRQAGDREIDRLRLLAGLALASWLGTLFFAPGLVGGGAARVWLGLGWLLLLGALGLSLAEQRRVARALERAGEEVDHAASPGAVTSAGLAGAVAPWLVVAGLAAVAAGVLVG